MRIKSVDKIVNELNEINIKELNNVKIGDALFYALYYFEKKSFVYELKAIFAPILKERYVVDRMGADGIVFVFSSAYSDRQDHRKKFDKVTNVICDSTVISSHKGLCLKNIRNLSLIWSINKQIKNINADVQTKRFIAYWIYTYICELKEVKGLLNKNDINLTAYVSYCDVMPVDSVFIQYFKNRGVRTVTLQHGQFNHKIDIGKAAFEKSHSDYFLCFGDYTKWKCSKLNMDCSRMIPLGPPDMIGQKMPKKMKALNRKTFGVVMSYFEFEQEDIDLIRFAGALCNKFTLKARIRLHPSLRRDDYEGLIDNSRMEICPEDESMNDFMNSIDFGIVGSSSVFQEFVVNMTPIFRYLIDKEKDTYDGIEGWSFSNERDLEIQVDKLYSDEVRGSEELARTRRILAPEGNIAKNYMDFFAKITKEAEV